MNHPLPNWKSLAAQRVPAVQPYDLRWQRRWLGYARYWRWQFFGWGFLLASQTFPSLTIPGDPYLASTLLISLSFFFLCLVCSHFLRGVLIGLRGCSLSWGGLLLRLFPWLILLSVVIGYLVCLTGVDLLPAEFSKPFPGQSPELLFLQNVVFTANGAFLILVLWVVCYFIHHLYAAYQYAQMERLRLEVSMREAELRHLRSQMDPHFLFNSLNTVRALISPENQEARGALTHLSEILRNSLRQGERSLIPLEEELSALENHLAIEQLRFGSRMVMKIHLAKGLETCLVPPLLIQTLVENAIKHGIAKREEGGTITLSICKNAGQLCCVICNPGTLEISQTKGLGLVNIQSRLKHLYQDSASFILQPRGPSQVRAAFRLPLQTSLH